VQPWSRLTGVVNVESSLIRRRCKFTAKPTRDL
jgi:hypothetical protein